MDLFEGLHSYETVLLVLGILFFLLLLFVLIFFVIKNRPIKSVVPLFLVSIIMMGFPGIQKIKFDKGLIEIEKLAKVVEKKPGDTAAKTALANKLAIIEKRPIKTPTTLKKLENAYTLIGDEKKVTSLKEQLRFIKPPVTVVPSR